MVDGETDLAQKAGIEIRYSARVLSLIHSESGVNGVKVKMEGKTHEIKSHAVVLACGGFESNTEWRTRYLGPGWEMAKVRGTCFNTGDGIRMALEVGASPYGNWSGCHAVGWDYNAPEFGDLTVETDSRNIPTHLESWSMPPGGASWTKAQISAITLMPNMDG